MVKCIGREAETIYKEDLYWGAARAKTLRWIKAWYVLRQRETWSSLALGTESKYSMRWCQRSRQVLDHGEGFCRTLGKKQWWFYLLNISSFMPDLFSGSYFWLLSGDLIWIVFRWNQRVGNSSFSLLNMLLSIFPILEHGTTKHFVA